MASAGRILIMPKGSYDKEVTYAALDMVNHNGTSWLARKEAVGIEPNNENSEYWQNMFELNIVNDSTATEEGSVLDARQANPDIEGTMAHNIKLCMQQLGLI